MKLFLALATTFVGLAWLALAMEVHWKQVRGAGRPAKRLLRVLGAVALAASLGICFAADHPTMAPLVWIMALAGSAVAIALLLAWRPRLLAPLAFGPER